MNDSKVVLKNVRFSYVNLFEKDDNGKYSVALLIKKDDPQVDELKKAIKAAAETGAGKLGQSFKLDYDKVLHDGDEKVGDANYAGHYYLNAKSSNKPGIVRKSSGVFVEITDPSDFYSGCYGAASVNFFAFNTGSNKGIGCGLNNVLKLQDGEFLGGRSSAQADFNDFVSEDDELC